MLGIFSARFGTPIVVNLLSGVVATITMIAAIQLAGGSNEKYFNAVFGVVLLFTTISYIAIFPTVIKLRYSHRHVHRPFKIPGGMVGVWVVGCMTTFFAVLATPGRPVPGAGGEQPPARSRRGARGLQPLGLRDDGVHPDPDHARDRRAVLHPGCAHAREQVDLPIQAAPATAGD